MFNQDLSHIPDREAQIVPDRQKRNLKVSLPERKVSVLRTFSKAPQHTLHLFQMQTPFGLGKVWFDETAVYRLDIEPRGQTPKRRDHPSWLDYVVEKDDISEQTLPTFLQNLFTTSAPLPVALCGTPQQIQVWRALSEIPWGETVSYGTLAERVFKHKRFARAVGGMVGRNPVSWFIPCHRVLASNGALNGFGCGLDVKRDMLALEAAA